MIAEKEEVKEPQEKLLSSKTLTEYKKKLRSEVEFLELEVRHVKARLDYIVFSNQFAQMQAEIAKLEEKLESEEPESKSPVEPDKPIKPIIKNLK